VITIGLVGSEVLTALNTKCYLFWDPKSTDVSEEDIAYTLRVE
jgi:hypothetical protein